MKRRLFIITLNLFAYILLLSSCHPKKELLTQSLTDHCSQYYQEDTVQLKNVLSPVDSLIHQHTGVYVLEDGGSALITRAWLTSHAEKSIDIQYFIFSTDNIGLIACDYLVRAADRGVKVRILIDDMMVDAELDDLLRMATHENIHIKVYNPGINLGKNLFSKVKEVATDFRSVNQRMHNKTFIVDNLITITGGRNIADEYFDYNHDYNFRDREILMMGTETQAVTSSFESFWDSELSVSVESISDSTSIPKDTDFDLLHQYACNPENFWPEIRENIKNFPTHFEKLVESGHIKYPDSIRFVSDEPGKNDGESGLKGGGVSTSVLIELIKNAKKSIDIQSPYLVTTDLGKQLVSEAISRGVSIKVLTNSLASTDNMEAFSGYQKDRNKLLKLGVELYEFRPDTKARLNLLTGELQKKINHSSSVGLHAKTMVIDDYITVIGTFNLDPRSANLNTECVTITYDKEIAKTVLYHLDQDYQEGNSWKITPSFNPDDMAGRYKRMKVWTRKALPKSIL